MPNDDRETLLPDSYCSSVLFPNTGNALHQVGMQRTPCPSGFHISIWQPHLANCLLLSSHHAERRTSICPPFNKDRWANRIGRWCVGGVPQSNWGSIVYKPAYYIDSHLIRPDYWAESTIPQ